MKHKTPVLATTILTCYSFCSVLVNTYQTHWTTLKFHVYEGTNPLLFRSLTFLLIGWIISRGYVRCFLLSFLSVLQTSSWLLWKSLVPSAVSMEFQGHVWDPECHGHGMTWPRTSSNPLITSPTTAFPLWVILDG